MLHRLCLAWAAVTALLSTPAAAAEPAAGAARRNVTFVSTSDSHYRERERPGNNELDRATLVELNAISGAAWPKPLGGDPIPRPRGVLLLGDVIDDGDKMLAGRSISAEQNQAFLADFGLDGTDGLLKYPVFEGWGNHDGPPAGAQRGTFSFQGQLKKRNQVRLSKGLISGLSPNGLHYSWDWDDVHLVQLNIYPADKQREGVRYSAQWHDPQGALSFLKQDLAEKVGVSGRPVVLMSHCGFDTDWWSPADWKDLYAAAKPYNVILYLYGHSGTGLREWAPEGESPKWTCVNDGQTTVGFFVIQIVENRLRLAYRCKAGLKSVKQADGTIRHEWPGTWEWRWPLDKKFIVAAKAPATAP